MPSELKLEALSTCYCRRPTGTFSGSENVTSSVLGNFQQQLLYSANTISFGTAVEVDIFYFLLLKRVFCSLWNGGAAVFHPRDGYISLVVELIFKCVQLATHLECFLEQKVFVSIE